MDIRAELIRNILVSIALFILVGYFCTANYINKKRALKYAEDVRTDDLTGLNNRGEFDRYLSVAAGSMSGDKKLFLLLFDADRFKSINDGFGHHEGDRALRIIAKSLMAVCSGTDRFCARYGGDEFVIICRCNDEAEIKCIREDMDNKLKAFAADEHLPYALSVSCGYACFDPNSQSLSDFVISADKRLYEIKAEKAKS